MFCWHIRNHLYLVLYNYISVNAQALFFYSNSTFSTLLSINTGICNVCLKLRCEDKLTLKMFPLRIS